MGKIDLQTSKEVIRKANDYFIQELGGLSEVDGFGVYVELLKRVDAKNNANFVLIATDNGIIIKIPTSISSLSYSYSDINRDIPQRTINGVAFAIVDEWQLMKYSIKKTKDRLTKEYNDVISKMPDFDPNK